MLYGLRLKTHSKGLESGCVIPLLKKLGFCLHRKTLLSSPMAATAICLQSRRNTSITLIRNPSPVQLFSSSSIPEPPNNAEDETTSPPQSQPHPSISSYFDDVKSSLRQKQQQQQQSPFQRSDFPSQRQQSPSSQFSNRVPPTVAPSFEEIRKNLSEFRSRTAAPPPPGVNSPSSFPSSPRPTQTVSFQELYKKSTMSRGDVPDNTDSTAKGGKLSYDMIRESIKHLRKNNSNDLNRGNESAHRSRLTDNLFGTEKSTPVYGGTDLSRDNVFGKENNKKTEGQSGEMKTKFLRMYTYDDLGQKLKMLRPEETEKKTGFSLKELSERLIKLRELEEKESEEKQPDSRFSSMKDIRETLVKLSSQENDKKKLSVHRIDILGQLGGTPNYMLSPPKESLVEKYFHPDNMSSAEKMKIELQKVRDEFKMSESDCGSTRVQVAQLTTKIKYLSTTLHKKDKHSRKGLVAMVQQRKKLLKYLRRTDWDSYCLVLDKLGLRDNPDHKN